MIGCSLIRLPPEQQKLESTKEEPDGVESVCGGAAVFGD